MVMRLQACSYWAQRASSRHKLLETQTNNNHLYAVHRCKVSLWPISSVQLDDQQAVTKDAIKYSYIMTYR